MTTKVLNYDEKIEVLLDFMRDTESIENLSNMTGGINIFDVLKISRTEIRHSNMLAWLLDPNGNHGLGSVFLYGIIASLSDVIDNVDKTYALKLLSSDLSSFNIFRERDNIDILLVSSELKTVIAIENKIGSKEHNSGKSDISQLEKYSYTISEKYTEYKTFLVFLTPFGDIPSVEGWQIMDYTTIISILEQVFKSRKERIAPEVRLIIKNYIDAIKKNVIMDEKLVTLCNEIYKKHKDAIDLIIENKDDKCGQVSMICRKKLEEYKLQGIEMYGSEKAKAYVRFTTEDLRNSFKKYAPIEVFFQFQIRVNDNLMRFELVCYNHGIRYNDDLINDIKMWAKRRNLDFDKSWERKRIWSEKKDDLENTPDDKIEEWIEKKIKESLSIGK